MLLRVARSMVNGFSFGTRGVLFAGALFLSGCSDDVHRLGGPGDDEREPVIALCRAQADFELIDDMEDKLDDSIDAVEDRAGFWFAFNDESATGVQIPVPNGPLYPMEPLNPPRDDSWYAIRSQGSGFTEWGAGIGFDLNTHRPYDASPYSGISFWARKEAESTSSIRLSITDSNTAPQGGNCEDTADTSVMNRCYDNFGAVVSLTDDWQFHEYAWSELSQEGFSGVMHPAIVNSKLYGVRFQVKADQAFDFLIDDIAFICKKN